MFEADDIKKVKNVKRNGGTEWAYFNDGEEKTLKLNFSKTQVKGGRELRVGEIILLFQKVDRIRGVQPFTYLTHLVTPLGKPIIRNDELEHKWKWELEVAVIARANPRTAIHTRPNLLSFRNPNWGKICNIEMLNYELTLNEIQKEIWNYFQPFFSSDLDGLLKSPAINNEEIELDFGLLEGREYEYVKTHLSRERNSVIIGLAKSRAFRKSNGRVLCACCDFDFLRTYGEHGLNFIEAHHIIPIGTGVERITRIEDLAMVCANCHRMLHRKIAGTDRYFNVKELRDHVIDRKINYK
ncbi:HNH endonuclease [Mucilaginibacter sp. CSA2-8R]|uniref:HNH endonuclease n=1 Tax=Mucilaginibacter sp. CSA2-8R TaxID=3141542 RepID=UPI00315D938B